MRWLVGLAVGLMASVAGAQPGLVEDPLRYGFDTFEGAGFDPVPAVGQLDSAQWIVRGVAAGDLAYGETGDSGAYARGRTADAGAEAGVWAFEVAAGNVALGARPSATELTPGAFETRFTNDTGAPLVSFSIAYDCWQFNDAPRATDLEVEVIVGGTGERLGELDCPGLGAPDATPGWIGETLGTVYTPPSPVAVDADVRVVFHFEPRGGGMMSFDQLAIDDVTFGLPATCGNGVTEPGDDCDDGDVCTMDTCVEPTGCSFDPIDMCTVDAGPRGDASTSLRDGAVPPRYDANMPPIERDRPDQGPATGPAPDGCDCQAGGLPAGAIWPLGFALLMLRRRR